MPVNGCVPPTIERPELLALVLVLDMTFRMFAKDAEELRAAGCVAASAAPEYCRDDCRVL